MTSKTSFNIYPSISLQLACATFWKFSFNFPLGNRGVAWKASNLLVFEGLKGLLRWNTCHRINQMSWFISCTCKNLCSSAGFRGGRSESKNRTFATACTSQVQTSLPCCRRWCFLLKMWFVQNQLLTPKRLWGFFLKKWCSIPRK